MKKYVQYGCGLSSPENWINFDSSPTLLIQRTFLIGSLLKNKTNVIFPKNVKYGDIIKGLPIANDSCDGIYCSHILEHLSYEDFKIAIKNTYVILKKGGIFRLVMPDLEYLVNLYLQNKKENKEEASTLFMKGSGLGLLRRKRGIRAVLESAFGSSRHHWLYDEDSAISELEKIGFKEIRSCQFNDCKDKMFHYVEDEKRFQGAIALEMTK